MKALVTVEYRTKEGTGVSSVVSILGGTDDLGAAGKRYADKLKRLPKITGINRIAVCRLNAAQTNGRTS